MARGRTTQDLTTLQMALVGYQLERDKIDAKIRELQTALRGRRTPGTTAAPAEKPASKRVLSPEARKRIAMAQKKRWAEHRRAKAQTKGSE